jgi:hypothetical protein
MDKPLVNRVANSGLITLNLEDFFPGHEVINFDLKDYLYMELMLKEKDFRISMKEHDWAQYEGKVVLVNCSTDAIIPLWAYMLVGSNLSPYAADVFQGTPEEYYKYAMGKKLDEEDWTAYEDRRVIIKGCGDKPVPASAYLDITSKLRPYAKSIMFGEACSTVPVFKKK